MSSNGLGLGEEEDEEKGLEPTSRSSRQGLGNDEKIDIESQRPPTESKLETMSEFANDASGGDPSPQAGSSNAGQSHVGGEALGDAMAASFLAAEASGNHPLIINVHLPTTTHEAHRGTNPEETTSHHPLQPISHHPPRDSWDYHAEDNFEIEQEVAISEVEQEVEHPHALPNIEEEQQKQQDHAPPHVEEEQQQHDYAPPPVQQPQEQEKDEEKEGEGPADLPTITRIKNEFRQKSNLSDLILPSAADEPPEASAEASAATAAAGPNEHALEVQPTSPTSPTETDSVVGDLPLLTSRRKPPRPTLYRVKTRLQDPPPITPAVSDQLASLWSDAGTRTRRNSTTLPPVGDMEGGQQAGFRPFLSRRMSMIRPPNVQEEDLHAQHARFGPATSRRFNLSGGEAVGGTDPTAAPSRLGLFSPSSLGLLSPSRLGLFSKSKANLAPPPPEEEQDPLDDDGSIPIYKKNKKKQHRTWFTTLQWLFLGALIIVLIFAVKFHALRKVIWREIALWQWLSLALVCISGRLIAGWCVKILVAIIERHYILKKRVLYFVYGLRHAVKNCIWLALVIGVWKLVFHNIEYENATTPIVTKVLWCLFTTSALWMLKILAVKVAANSFHRAAYFDRVQDCLFHQYVLETLSAPPLVSTPDRSRADLAPPGPRRSAGEQHQQPQHQQQHVSTGKHPESHHGFQANQRSLEKEKLETTVEEEDSPQPKASLARAPSRIYMGTSPKGSRKNLTSASRLNLGGTLPRATPSNLHSPLGRARRVSVNVEQTPTIPRTTVPISQDKLQELNSETVSAWTLKRLMKMIRKTNIATFSSILEREEGSSIDSEANAKVAAKQIFYNIAQTGAKHLTLGDFLDFLPEEQATRAFALFELNDAGHITKKALMKWVVNVYKERRSLALTLSDNRTVVAKLHRVLDVLLFGIAVTICFLIMGISTQKLLVGFSSVLLPSVFVFGNAARSTFESLIFLFVMHPYDVGDRVNIDGATMIVEEMNILNTIFLSGSNEKVYYPNSILATKSIANYYRSPDMWDAIEFQIHSATPVEQLGVLKDRMTKYVEGLPQFWYPVFRIVCKDIEDSTKMRMALWIQHHLNWQESGERWQRRSNLLLHMKTQLEELGIGFHLPRQEITVTGIPLLDVPAPRHATPV